MADQLLFGGSIGGIDVVEEAMRLAARMAASKLRMPNSSNTFERHAYQLPVVRYLQRALLRCLAYGSQLCVHDCIDGFGFKRGGGSMCVRRSVVSRSQDDDGLLCAIISRASCGGRQQTSFLLFATLAIFRLETTFSKCEAASEERRGSATFAALDEAG
jgi:hypothetical protein